MDNGAKFTQLLSDASGADGLLYDQARSGLRDYPIDSTHAIVSESTPLESHSERISCFIAELDTITKRVCEAARKGAEHADRIEARLLHELANLRAQLLEKDASLQGLEMALAELQRATKNKIAELQKRLRAQESEIADQHVELQRLRSGRDYLTCRIDETQAAAKAAQLEAARMKERWQSEAVEHKLKVAEYEQWLSEKHLRLERLENDTRSTIDQLEFRLRQSEELLAHRDRGIQPATKLAAAGFNSRAKNLDPPRANLQAARKAQRA